MEKQTFMDLNYSPIGYKYKVECFKDCLDNRF